MQVILQKERRKRTEEGHPWIYASDIQTIEGEVEPGSIVDVVNHQRHFLARGYYNPHSQIAVRILSYRPDERIDASFIRRRIEQAWHYRLRLLPEAADAQACRVVFGEADFLPGLVVDRFGPVVVIQILTAGMERMKDWVVKAIRDVLKPQGIYERSDVPVREREGLLQSSGLLWGDVPGTVEIREHGLKLLIDVAEGQKTGYFLDQRENRAAIAPVVRWAVGEKPRLDQRYRPAKTNDSAMLTEAHSQQSGRKGADVLECFSHTGSFTVHACEYGANHVTCLDISAVAIDVAKQNVERNGFLDRVDFLVANAFDQLRLYEREKRMFDVVILDPPAFAKSRAAVEGALRGYKEINLRGMKLIPDGGFLVTASCSFHVSPSRWLEVISEAATDARKILRMVEYRGAGRDHPQILGVDEADYLKFAIFEVRGR